MYIQMNNKEAIRRIEEHMRIHKLNEPNVILITQALKMAIQALQYVDAIGIDNISDISISESNGESPKCKCWKEGHWWIKGMDTCLGTREQDPCDCKGDKSKCNYYKEKK